MPGKKKKDGKKKKGGKKKKPKGMLESPGVVVKRLYKTYLDHCAKKNQLVCPGLKTSMKDCYDNDRLFVKFIVEPFPDFSDPEFENVGLDPVVSSIRSERYKYIKELHVWDIPMKHEHVANLALMMEYNGVYPITRLDLIDCNIGSYSVGRLVKGSSLFHLTALSLDYNEFGDEGVVGLSQGLQGNKVLLSLSLCYCDLGVQSGTMLGQLISTTAIREVYLNGNNLEAEGAIEIIKLAADQAEMESIQREEEARLKAEREAQELLEAKERARIGTAMSQPEEKPASAKSSKSGKGSAKKKKKKKGKKGKKSKEPPPPPPVGPWIHKLHLADNGIDSFGPGSNYGPVIAMRLFRQLIQFSVCLEELDLDDNLIGDLGGRSIMEGLRIRKEVDLPGMKVSVTHRMNGDTFDEIVKLGAGLKKKKKKKGKGKKKKKK